MPRIEITLSTEQEDRALAALECSASATNFAIAAKIESYQATGRSTRYNEISREWTTANPYKGKVARIVAQRAMWVLEKQWYEAVVGKRKNFPKRIQGATPIAPAQFGAVSHDDTHIHLPLIGEVAYLGEIHGEIQYITVWSEDGKWYANVTVGVAEQSADTPLEETVTIPDALHRAASDAVRRRRFGANLIEEAQRSQAGLVRLAHAFLDVVNPLRSRIAADARFSTWRDAIREAERIVGADSDNGVLLSFAREVANG